MSCVYTDNRILFLFSQAFPDSQASALVPEENLKMDLDTEALVDAENNINTTPRLVMQCKRYQCSKA